MIFGRDSGVGAAVQLRHRVQYPRFVLAFAAREIVALRLDENPATAPRSPSTTATIATLPRWRHSFLAVISSAPSGRASIGSPRTKRRRVLRERLRRAVAFGGLLA